VLTPDELDTVRRHAEADYPAECCGVLLTRPDPAGGPELRRLVACRNDQDELHARDPVRFPRTARTAYYIAHQDLLAIGRSEAEGWRLAVIYHSHVDAGSYFSETDRRNALVDGQPAYPGTLYVVVAVHGGRAAGHSAYRWDEARQDFVDATLQPQRR
jgi:proteasome lid subunit RPN8/RPN11